MTAAEIKRGDYVAYVADDGTIRRIEACIVEHDFDVVHVRSWGPRVVTFPLDYPVRRCADVEIVR
jgi:hypothetical protein